MAMKEATNKSPNSQAPGPRAKPWLFQQVSMQLDPQAPTYIEHQPVYKGQIVSVRMLDLPSPDSRY